MACDTYAQTYNDMSCDEMDGAVVFSWEDNPVYLGFFGVSSAWESIMNFSGPYGSNSGADSVRNIFGKYGDPASKGLAVSLQFRLIVWCTTGYRS